MNTKTSSAPIPRTTKMIRKLMNWKKTIWHTTRNKKNATKMEHTVMLIDVSEISKLLVWYAMYIPTQMKDKIANRKSLFEIAPTLFP